MTRTRLAALAGLLAFGLATPALAEMRAPGVVIAQPRADTIIEPDAETFLVTGWASDSGDARCCDLRISYHHQTDGGSGGEDEGRWVTFLTDTLEADNLVGGIVIDPDGLIDGALTLVDPSDTKAFAAHRAELTTDQVSDWKIELFSKIDGALLARQPFGLRGRASANAPAPQFAPVTSAEDLEAPSSAPEAATARGPQAKAIAAQLAALQAKNLAATSSGPKQGAAQILITAPRMDEAGAPLKGPFPLQISTTDPAALGRCCQLVLSHYAIINQPDGSTRSDWVAAVSTPLGGAVLEQGLLYDMADAREAARTRYEADPVRFKAQLKRLEAGAPENWRIEVLADEGSNVAGDVKVITLAP